MNDTIAIVTDSATGYKLHIRRCESSSPLAKEAEIEYQIDLLRPEGANWPSEAMLIDSTVTVGVLSDGTGPYEHGVHDRISY